MLKKKTNLIWYLLAFFGIAFVIFFVLQKQDYRESLSGIETYEQVEVSFERQEVPKLETWIADTTFKRSRGLSVVEKLLPNQAMLFVFEESGRHPFWMKDMKFAIDIMWINERGEIIYIKEQASPQDYPEHYAPDETALYVLETTSGFVSQYEIQKNDRVSWIPQ